MAWPERRICCITVGCGGRIGAICDSSTMLHVVGSGWSCVRAGAWLLVVLVTSSEEQSVGAAVPSREVRRLKGQSRPRLIRSARQPAILSSDAEGNRC